MFWRRHPLMTVEGNLPTKSADIALLETVCSSIRKNVNSRISMPPSKKADRGKGKAPRITTNQTGSLQQEEQALPREEMAPFGYGAWNYEV